MKKMLLTLALLPLFAVPAATQDASWKDLAAGDRIEITLLNGSTLCGALAVPRSKTLPVDFAKESSITLDLSTEIPGLVGTMTFAKHDLVGFRRLRVKVGPPCDLKGPPRKNLVAVAPAAEPPKPEQDPKTPPPPPADKDAEELKKAVDFYAKFPPPDWGPVRHTLIVQKQARGQTPTPAEREFESGYPDLWEKGRDASKKN